MALHHTFSEEPTRRRTVPGCSPVSQEWANDGPAPNLRSPHLGEDTTPPTVAPQTRWNTCAGRVNEVARFVVTWCLDGTPEKPITARRHEPREPRALALAVRPEAVRHLAESVEEMVIAVRLGALTLGVSCV